MKKYQVIWNFNGWKWVGEADNIISAKRIATRNEKRPGYFGDVRKPDIYNCVDVIDGPVGRVPSPNAKPAYRWMDYTGEWVEW